MENKGCVDVGEDSNVMDKIIFDKMQEASVDLSIEKLATPCTLDMAANNPDGRQANLKYTSAITADL